MKKKAGIVIVVLLIAAGAGVGIWHHFIQGKTEKEASSNAVFVDSVGTITGLTGSGGLFSRYSGVIEPQKTEKIQLASGLTVKKNYVSVGDEVEVGT